MNKHENSFEISLAKFVGSIEEQAKSFALSIGVLPAEFTPWLGTVLLGVSPTVRSVLGPPHRLSHLPSYPSEEPKGKRRKVALALPSPGNGTRKVAPKKRSRPVGYWARMTPEQRSAEMYRRMEVSRRRKNEVLSKA